MEKIHIEQKIPCFIVGFPQSKQHLLPEWVKPIENIEELPDNCLALIDEASFKYHSHKVRGKESEFMDKLISVSGQKKQTLIFCTHTMRKFSVTLLMEIDVLLCKEPSMLHSNLERGEVRKLTEEVKKEFGKLPREDVKKSTFVVTDGHRGFMRNPLPSYWSEELSEAWSGIDLKEKTTNNVASSLNTIKYPVSLTFRIWFKPEDKNRVLDILITIDGKRLDENSITCTKDKCSLAFDMKHIGDGFYIPTSKRFNWLEIFEKMKDISYMLDTETNIVDGEPYPISKDHLIFDLKKKNQQKKEDDFLNDYADKVKL